MMRTLVAVADAQSFAGAARRSNLSAAAVTRAIAELEKRLGVQLLIRTTRAMRMTDAGGRYVEDCRRILSDIKRAEENALGVDAGPSGLLTITAPAIFGRLYVSPIVTEYLERYTEVNATCWFNDRVVNLADEGVDLGVRIGDLPRSEERRVGKECRL